LNFSQYFQYHVASSTIFNPGSSADHPWDPTLTSQTIGAPSAARIIQDVDRFLDHIQKIHDAHGTIVAGLGSRSGWRNLEDHLALTSRKMWGGKRVKAEWPKDVWMHDDAKEAWSGKIERAKIAVERRRVKQSAVREEVAAGGDGDVEMTDCSGDGEKSQGDVVETDTMSETTDEAEDAGRGWENESSDEEEGEEREIGGSDDDEEMSFGGKKKEAQEEEEEEEEEEEGEEEEADIDKEVDDETADLEKDLFEDNGRSTRSGGRSRRNYW